MKKSEIVILVLLVVALFVAAWVGGKQGQAEYDAAKAEWAETVEAQHDARIENGLPY